MAQYQELSAGILSLRHATDTEVTRQVRVTKNVTRATVLAEFEDGLNNPPVGSLILSGDRAYIRVAANNAAADYEKITTTAAD